MPGYIIHLAAARLALDKLGCSDFDYRFKVYVGSVLADTMARENKRESHFWSEESVRLLKRMPEVDAFEEKYGELLKDSSCNPIVPAYKAHLYMDRRFVGDYWTRHFEFYNDDMKPETGYDEVTVVKITDTGELIPRSVFLSDDYYYGDYTRLLPYITYKYALKDIFGGHSMEYIASELDKLDCSIIEEVRGNDYKTCVMGMFENIYKTMEDEKPPKLKVFDLSELEKLISDTAHVTAYADGAYMYRE
jgi:hypothetical protein